MGRAKRYNDAICRILLREWDPIGVADIPEAYDEYNMYAGGVAAILMRGEPKDKLVEYLWTIETENMGLDGNRTRIDRQPPDCCSFVARSMATPNPTGARDARPRPLSER